MTLRGEIELAFANWVFGYWVGSFWAWTISLASDDRTRLSWSIPILSRDGPAPDCSVGFNRCLIIAHALACERHAIHD
jgi:hypothetical protein